MNILKNTLERLKVDYGFICKSCGKIAYGKRWECKKCLNSKS